MTSNGSRYRTVIGNVLFVAAGVLALFGLMRLAVACIAAGAVCVFWASW